MPLSGFVVVKDLHSRITPDCVAPSYPICHLHTQPDLLINLEEEIIIKNNFPTQNHSMQAVSTSLGCLMFSQLHHYILIHLEIKWTSLQTWLCAQWAFPCGNFVSKQKNNAIKHSYREIWCGILMCSHATSIDLCFYMSWRFGREIICFTASFHSFIHSKARHSAKKMANNPPLFYPWHQLCQSKNKL